MNTRTWQCVAYGTRLRHHLPPLRIVIEQEWRVRQVHELRLRAGIDRRPERDAQVRQLTKAGVIDNLITTRW